MPTEPTAKQGTLRGAKLASILASTAAWAWAFAAGGGGFLLLLEKGPLPLTNGWFAMFSGISACPLTATLIRRFGGVTISGWIRLSTALAFLIAGRAALILGI